MTQHFTHYTDLMKTIFLTGATGFLGSYLLKVFLDNGHKVYALSRAKKEKNASLRVDDVLRFWGGAKNTGNLKVLEGDITVAGLNLDKKAKDELFNETGEIFHAAAVTNLNYSFDKISKINVLGASNVFDLACDMHKAGKDVKVGHISTAFIFGDHRGVFSEKDLDVGQKFNTTYEQSKFLAEKKAEEYRKKGLWIDVYRPPIIMAHSRTGKAFRFRNVYQLLHVCSLKLFDSLPVSNPLINIVPVDLVSEAIYAIAMSSARTGPANYHPFPGDGALIDDIIGTGCSLMGIKKPKIVNLKDFDFNSLTPVQKIILENNIMSMEFKAKLDSKATLSLLKKLGFSFPEVTKELLSNMMKYYVAQVINAGKPQHE